MSHHQIINYLSSNIINYTNTTVLSTLRLSIKEHCCQCSEWVYCFSRWAFCQEWRGMVLLQVEEGKRINFLTSILNKLLQVVVNAAQRSRIAFGPSTIPTVLEFESTKDTVLCSKRLRTLGVASSCRPFSPAMITIMILFI
jgi:hypothetical protein